MKKKPVNPSISRWVILRTIEDYLDSVDQWVSYGLFENATRYLAKADALIALLEIDDCGSYGGFDTRRGQDPKKVPGNRSSLAGIKARYEWLKSIS